MPIDDRPILRIQPFHRSHVNLANTSCEWSCHGNGVSPGAALIDVIDVQHGGTIEGTVSLEGAVPEPKGFNLITFPDPAILRTDFERPGLAAAARFRRRPERGLKDAIVFSEGVEAGKPFEVSVPLD